jgi:hypothetical protein
MQYLLYSIGVRKLNKNRFIFMTYLLAPSVRNGGYRGKDLWSWYFKNES